MDRQKVLIIHTHIFNEKRLIQREEILFGNHTPSSLDPVYQNLEAIDAHVRNIEALPFKVYDFCLKNR
jgi:hypothetical protein